ncbi:MAG: hypothetical protein R2854_04505 [Caldilineaceae bacterium]
MRPGNAADQRCKWVAASGTQTIALVVATTPSRMLLTIPRATPSVRPKSSAEK